MPYIERHKDGSIGASTRWPSSEGQEQLAEDHPDVVAFRNRPEPPTLLDELLDALDEVAGNLPPASRAKLDALLARRAAENGGAGIT